ncbi:MAG: GMC family oxidoreductase [Deltaproteobacteria bacterium]|nr:GMC family oxidoreductase [Deltaproteobacteria bacterium]
MKASYDVIVIGSGFGGSVAACRMAQSACSVGVLERGKSYETMNSFPRDWSDPLNGWLWSVGQGLFDVRPFEEMTVVQGAGLGGGSLIYANVHLRAPEDVFTSGWPQGYTRAALDPYYDLVAYMLDINPITRSHSLGIPTKTELMKRIAERLGRSQQFCYPNIAVDLSAPGTNHQNKFGVDQQGCRFCGECDIGCNVHAKNTLDLNYLALARKHGAEIGTLCEVTGIRPRQSGGSNYVVTYKDHGDGGTERQCEAKYVFVCCGAVNSTELLLRCRDIDQTLPNISRRLGYGYSGNGDFLAFAFNTKEPFKPSEGPTITTGIVYSRTDGGSDTWFIFEEGGYPKEVGGIVQLLNPREDWFHHSEVLTREAFRQAFRHKAQNKGGFQDPRSDNSAVFLAMGRDLADGLIELHPVSKTARIRWNTPGNLPLYRAEERFSTDVAEAMGGDVAFNPLWRLFHVPVTVHNLGGCLMADSPHLGVVDPSGEVYGHQNLFVLDGAILPKATGSNPSHTIAAVAERCVEAIVQRIPQKSGWRAPEMSSATHIKDPLSSIAIPAGGTIPTATRPPLSLGNTQRSVADSIAEIIGRLSGRSN